MAGIPITLFLIMENTLEFYTKLCIASLEFVLNSPSNICIKRGHLRVEILVSLDEHVLIDLPDFPVVVPRAEIVL